MTSAASYAVELPRAPEAGAVARRVVTDSLSDRLPARALGDLVLAVTELVTNAVVHGEGRIELRLATEGGTVTCEVIDEGGGFEHEIRRGGIDQVGGLGLFVVGEVAERWGVHGGTTHVWFEMPIGGSSKGIDEPELGQLAGT